jgi:hypothetical protein
MNSRRIASGLHRTTDTLSWLDPEGGSRQQRDVSPEHTRSLEKETSLSLVASHAIYPRADRIAPHQAGLAGLQQAGKQQPDSSFPVNAPGSRDARISLATSPM